MAATRQDLITLVLENLGVLAAGQSAAIEDRETVNRRIDPKLAELARREVIADLNADALDASVFLYVADVVAYACRTAFGITGAKAQDLTAAAQSAEAMLKGMSRQFSPSAATAAFDIVRDVLERLGVVAPGQDPTAQDRGVVAARVAPLIADLRARGVIRLAGTELADADPAMLPHLAALLAARCAPAFGADAPTLALLAQTGEAAEAALTAMSRQFDAGTGTNGTFDIIQAVLEALGVVAAGQSGSPKDRAVVAARIPPMLSDLRAREITTFLDIAQADAAHLRHLAEILTAICAPTFGVEGAARDQLAKVADSAERQLNAMARQFDAGLATNGAFDLIQVTLENLGAVAVGRTATDKDRAIVSGRVTAVLDDLRNREVIDLPSLAGAAPSTLLQLSVILTSACAMAFGVPTEARQALRAEALQAEAALSRQARQLDAGAGTSGSFDLVQVVLETLGVVGAGQSASAKDRSVVVGRVAPVLAELRAREVIAIASLAAADAAMLVPLSAIVAAACAPSFGIPAQAQTGFDAAAARAETVLNAMARQFDANTGTGGTFDYIQSALETLGVVSGGQTASAKDRAVVEARVPPLLADLRARRIIDLSSAAAITAETQHLIATLLAARCAPLFRVGDAMLVGLRAEELRAEAGLREIARQLDGGAGTSGAFDLTQSVLELLGIVSAGQTASAKDRAVVTARIPVLLADLRQREIINLASADAADGSTKLHLAALLAFRCGRLFGLPDTMLAGLKVDASEAEAALRRIARQIDGGTAVSGTFDIVQSVLETLRVVEAGQTASTNDRAVVSARIAPMLADLKQREVITITSLAAVDPAMAPHVAAILTARCASTFGVEAATLAVLIQNGAAAEVALSAMARQFDQGIATSGAYDIHQTVLETIGVVRAGQTGSAKDRSIVAARVGPMLADLRAREITAFLEIEQASPAQLRHLASILVAICAPVFGAEGSACERFAAVADSAEQQLRAMSRQFDGGVATSGTFDLVQAVLENLSVVAAGYTGSAKDRAVVSARIAPTLADLSLREVVGFASLDVVPPGALIHLSVVLTAACAQAFGVPVATRTLFAAEAVKAEAALRAIARQLDTGTATSGSYDPIQAVLEMLGIVSAGQTASEKDRAVVLARVQPKLLELYTRDICGVTDISLLATELQLAFTKCLAAECAPFFGEVAPARIGMVLAMVPAAEAALRYGSFVYDARPALRLERVWGRRRCGYVV